MSELERMQRYIELTKMPTRVAVPYGMNIRELGAVKEVSREEGLVSALYMAFRFGMAKGWRAAKANAGK